MSRYLSAIASKFERFWCRMLHPAPMWPVNGHYICPQCQLRYRVTWSDPVPKYPEAATGMSAPLLDLSSSKVHAS